MRQVDDFAAAQDLSDRLEATIPFQVKPGKELLKSMRSEGNRVNEDTIFNVNFVKYSGDMGGISCGLEPDESKTMNSAYVVSLTHVKIDPDHPLAEEVIAYQQRRIRGLKREGAKPMALELSKKGVSVKRRTSKGFGK